eukprot:6280916-Alexandrium_andersonii.AAC.1
MAKAMQGKGNPSDDTLNPKAHTPTHAHAPHTPHKQPSKTSSARTHMSLHAKSGPFSHRCSAQALAACSVPLAPARKGMGRAPTRKVQS